MCYVKSVNKGQLSPSPSSASSVVSATGATTTADQLTGLNFYTSAQTPNAFYSLGSDSTSSGVTTEGGLSLFDELAFFDSAPGTSPSLLSFLGTDGVGMSAGTPFNFMGTSTAPAPDLLWNTASLSPSSSLSGSSINNNAPVFKFETPEQAPLTPHPSLSPTLAGTEEVSSSTNTTTKKRSLQQAEGGESESVPEQLLIKRQRNKEAAQRSRSKKLNRLQELEAQVSTLESERNDLSIRLAVMDTEKKLWRAREDELKLRIERLENCLLRKMVSPVADPAVSALLM